MCNHLHRKMQRLDKPNNDISESTPPPPAPLPPVEPTKPRNADSADFKLGYKSYGDEGKVQMLDRTAEGNEPRLNFDKVKDKKPISTTDTVLVPMVVSKRYIYI